MKIISIDLNTDPVKVQLTDEFNKVIDCEFWDTKYQLLDIGEGFTRYVAIGNCSEGNLYDATAIYSNGNLIELQNINKVERPSMDDLQSFDLRNIAERGFSDNKI